MSARLLRLVAGLLLVLLPVAVRAQQSATPVLRIETGTHTALMGAAAADAAGRILVTASNDKTARIWSLPELRPLGVLRPPIGPGNEGSLYAVAVAPDGRFAAVGGWTGTVANDSIYLFDLQTRQIVHRWGDLPEVIDSLAISPDGHRLAAGFGPGKGVHVWSLDDGSEQFADTSCSGSIYGLSFATDGRLVTTCEDGTLRLYGASGLLLHKISTVAGKRPYHAVFKPDGNEIAVGFDDAMAAELRDGHTLALLARPDVSNLSGGELARIAWSIEGSVLYGGGDAWINGSEPTLGWLNGGRGARGTIGPGFSDAASDIVPLSWGGLVSTSLSGDLAVIAPNGKVVGERHPDSANLNTMIAPNDPTRTFMISADARVVAFMQPNSNGRWDIVNTAGFAVGPDKSAPFGLNNWSASNGGLTITDWIARPDVKLNGRPLALYPYEWSRAVDVRPGRVLLGASWSLRLFDGAGKQLWQQVAPGTTWRVNQSQDGRIAVAAFGDGTVRWYRMSDGRELLALFLTRDGQRWVAFTPSGYYAASAGGEDLIGWQVNRGPDAAADFFPASQFRDRFYRPDVVMHVLDTLDEAQAVRDANAARGAPAAPAAPIVQDLPPVVTILAPVDGTQITGDEAAIQYAVRSPSGKPLHALRVLIDGRPAPGARGLGREPAAAAAANGEQRGQVAVAIPAGKTVEVALVVDTDSRSSDPARVRLTGAPASPAQEASRALLPRLNAVIVGISQYKDSRLDLGYAAADATQFGKLLDVQRNLGLYREVNVRVLTDADATRVGVLDALDWLRKQTTSNDVALVFMAGHGVEDEGGNTFFLPEDGDPERLISTAVAQADLQSILARSIAGKVVAFLDICHAGGAVLAQGRRGLPDQTKMVNELAQAGDGLIVFAAARANEVAIELPQEGHGAFTEALLEGLAGKADLMHGGSVRTDELNVFLADRVRDLTGGKQHPVMLRPHDIADFPMVAVAKPQ